MHTDIEMDITTNELKALIKVHNSFFENKKDHILDDQEYMVFDVNEHYDSDNIHLDLENIEWCGRPYSHVIKELIKQCPSIEQSLKDEITELFYIQPENENMSEREFLSWSNPNLK